MVKRFDVYLVNLDAEASKDAKNTRPCVVISPDEMNGNIGSVIVTPLSSTVKTYPTRVPLEFLNKERCIVLDQIRTVDKSRLVKKIGEIEKPAQKHALETLQEMFAE